MAGRRKIHADGPPRDGASPAIRLHVERSGSSPRTVLLVHGWCGSTRYWDRVVGSLSRELTTVAVDLRGFGRSPAPPGDYSFPTLEADILSVADDLGVERFAIVGHSLGGALALHVALSKPERVGGLVVVDSGAARGNQRIEQVADRLLERGLTPTELAAAVRGWFHRLADEEVRPFVGIASQASPVAMAEAARALLDRDMRGELAGLRVPSLIMLGEHDRSHPPEEARALRDAIPGAELHVFRAVGHCPQIEAPAEFVSVLASFLERRARW